MTFWTLLGALLMYDVISRIVDLFMPEEPPVQVIIRTKEDEEDDT